MEYVTLKESGGKWGVFPAPGELLLCRWSYSRCCENSYDMACTKGCGKTGRQAQKETG